MKQNASYKKLVERQLYKFMCTEQKQPYSYVILNKVY